MDSTQNQDGPNSLLRIFCVYSALLVKGSGEVNSMLLNRTRISVTKRIQWSIQREMMTDNQTMQTQGVDKPIELEHPLRHPFDYRVLIEEAPLQKLKPTWPGIHLLLS
jgi:hypothetical protein